MSDTQQGPGWWLASDGKWYPPDQATLPPPPPPEMKPSPPLRNVLGIIGAIVAFALVAAVYSEVTADDEPTIDVAPVSQGLDYTTSEGASMTAQERALVDEIDAIYPGIAPRRTLNWSRYLCDDIDGGMSGDALTERAVQRYAGGSRPDPTLEQAAQIVAAVEASGIC